MMKGYKLKFSINLKLHHYIIMKNVYKNHVCVCFIYKCKEFKNTWITKISIFLISKNFIVDGRKEWVCDGRSTQLREMAWWPSFATRLCITTNGFDYVRFQETSNTIVIGFWESSCLFHGKYLGCASGREGLNLDSSLLVKISGLFHGEYLGWATWRVVEGKVWI